MKKSLRLLALCCSLCLLSGLGACQQSNPSSSAEASVSSSEEAILHTVTFENYDDSVLLTLTVHHLSLVTYTGETPTRPADNDYVYTFTGWDKADQLNRVKEDLVLHALYSTSANAFEVIFYGDAAEKTILQKTTAHYGDYVHYDGVLPFGQTPDDYAQTSYQGFEDWDYDCGWKPIIADTKIHPIFHTVYYSSIFTTGMVSANGQLSLPSAYGLTSYSGNEATILIPSILVGEAIVSLEANLFARHGELKAVSFYGSYLQYLRAGVFDDDYMLKNLTLPTSVKIIDFYAFRDCHSFTAFTLPAATKTLGYGILQRCYYLADLQVAKGNTVFTSEDGILLSANHYAIYGYACGSSAKSLLIPGNVGIIYDGAFDEARNLETITIPSDGYLEKIYPFAFADCPLLTRFAFPANLTFVAPTAFSGDEKLVSFSVASGNKVFSTLRETMLIQNGSTVAIIAPGLSYVQLLGSSAYTTLGSQAAYGSQLTKALIGQYITAIDDEAFASSDNLEGLDFEGRSQGLSFGAHVFANCASLTSFTFPKYTTSVGKEAFINDGTVESVSFAAYDGTNFSGYLTTIGDNPFKGCDGSVSSVILPSSLTALPAKLTDGTASNASFFTTMISPNNFVAMEGYGASGLDASKQGNVLFYSGTGSAGDTTHRWWHMVNNVPTPF
jgi:hypothetical protein